MAVKSQITLKYQILDLKSQYRSIFPELGFVNEIHPRCDFSDNERENCIGEFPNNPLELGSEDEIESLNHITMILKKHFANKRI